MEAETEAVAMEDKAPDTAANPLFYSTQPSFAVMKKSRRKNPEGEKERNKERGRREYPCGSTLIGAHLNFFHVGQVLILNGLNLLGMQHGQLHHFLHGKR